MSGSIDFLSTPYRFRKYIMMKVVAILMAWLAVLGVYWALVSRNSTPAPPVAHATMDILLDGPDLFIDFDVPAVQLMGFSHAPKTPEEHTALVEAHRLLDSGLMTVPSAAANCTLTESFATVGHGYDDLCSSGESTLGAASPTLPAPSAKATPTVVWPTPEAQSLISARWAWTCEQPASLDMISVKLFEKFSHLQDLTVTTEGVPVGAASDVVQLLDRQNTDINYQEPEISGTAEILSDELRSGV